MKNFLSIPTRREFLKTSAVVGAAATGLSVARSAHAASDGDIKVGLIGCGGRGTGAAVNAMNAGKEVKLVAMADAFQDHAETSFQNAKKAKPDQVLVTPETIFSGFDAYKKLLASDVDVVILASTPHFRPKHLRAAVEAGKHIFCEKPVAVDAPGIRSVYESTKMAEEKKLNLVSGLCWRYHPGVQETMKRLLDGAIGDICAMQETYMCGMVGRRVERKPDMSEMEYQMRSWYYFNWLSGDHNTEQHVHSLDKSSWMMGDKPPLRVWGSGGKQTPKLGNIYDHFCVTYEYDNGVKTHAYCRQQPNCYSDTSDQYIGTKGTVNVLKHRIDGENKWRYKGPGGNMYDLEHKALFDAIRSGGEKYVNNGNYMATSTMLAIAGRMACYTGQALTWEQALASKEVLGPKSYAMDAEPPVMPEADGSYKAAVPGVTPFV